MQVYIRLCFSLYMVLSATLIYSSRDNVSSGWAHTYPMLEDISYSSCRAAFAFSKSLRMSAFTLSASDD